MCTFFVLFARITIQLFIGTAKMSMLFFFQIETVYYLFSPFFPTFCPTTSKIYFHHSGVRQNKKKNAKIVHAVFFSPQFRKMLHLPKCGTTIVFWHYFKFIVCFPFLFAYFFLFVYTFYLYINYTYERQKRFLCNPLLRVILKKS